MSLKRFTGWFHSIWHVAAVVLVFATVDSTFAQSPLTAVSTAAKSAVQVNVLDFGNTGDGVTFDTPAIQKIIDQCSADGGGKVLFPAGRYSAGTLQIKDNVTLHLDDHATLLGSARVQDYRNVDLFKDGKGSTMGYALLIGVDAKNIGIEGKGVIDGQGKLVADAQKADNGYRARPFLIRLPGGGNKAGTKIAFADEIKTYPKLGKFGSKMPSYGLYARHTRGLKVNNLTLTLAKPDQRPESFTDDATGNEFTNWIVPSNPTRRH